MKVVSLAFDPEVLESHIQETVREMGKIYSLPHQEGLKLKGEPGWSDADSANGLIITAEALECIFIPYQTMSGFSEKFWKGELLDLKLIRDSIQYLVEGYRADTDGMGPLGLPGTPYIDFRKICDGSGQPSGLTTNYDFLDTACFLVCALLDAKAINHHRRALVATGRIPQDVPELIPPSLLASVDDRISSCLRLLRDCDVGPGQGWTYTNDPEEKERLDLLYFTWNALESIEVIAEYCGAPGMLPGSLDSRLTEGLPPDQYYGSIILRDKLGGLSRQYLSPKDNKEFYIGESTIKFEGETESYFYNLFALLSLMVCRSMERDYIVKALGYLIRQYAVDTERRKISRPEHGKFDLVGSRFDEHKWYWGERAFLPLLLKACARFKELFPGDESEAELLRSINDTGRSKGVRRVESLHAIVEAYLEELNRLGIQPVTGLGFQHLWDSARGSKYSIYYTQRVIEALCRVYTAWWPERRPPRAEFSTIQAATQPGASELARTPVSITITADVISETIRQKMAAEVDQVIAEKLAHPDFARRLREAVSEAEESEFVLRVANLINNLVSQIDHDALTGDFKVLLDSLRLAVSRVIATDPALALYECLKAVSPSFGEAVEFSDFKERFRKVFVYLADVEKHATSKDERVDYSDTLTNFEAKVGLARKVVEAKTRRVNKRPT